MAWSARVARLLGHGKHSPQQLAGHASFGGAGIAGAGSWLVGADMSVPRWATTVRFRQAAPLGAGDPGCQHPGRYASQAGGLAPRIARLLVQPRSEAHAVGMNETSFMSDKPVNRIGFGAMQLAGPVVFGPPRDPDGARAVLRHAVELGVDHIDTA